METIIAYIKPTLAILVIIAFVLYMVYMLKELLIMLWDLKKLVLLGAVFGMSYFLENSFYFDNSSHWLISSVVAFFMIGILWYKAFTLMYCRLTRSGFMKVLHTEKENDVIEISSLKSQKSKLCKRFEELLNSEDSFSDINANYINGHMEHVNNSMKNRKLFKLVNPIGVPKFVELFIESLNPADLNLEIEKVEELESFKKELRSLMISLSELERKQYSIPLYNIERFIITVIWPVLLLLVTVKGLAYSLVDLVRWLFKKDDLNTNI